MAIRDERWRLVVVYASGRREGEEAASHPLIGLDERTVCRMFGFKGSHVPSFPVEVEHEHLRELQTYSATPIRLPAGTYAELVLDRDATTARDLVPLLAITVFFGFGSLALWNVGGSLSGGGALAAHIVAVLIGLVAVWSLISTLLVAGVVRADARLARRSGGA
jgi:uncharacterized membrane protein YuzA (DUF378 family)